MRMLLAVAALLGAQGQDWPGWRGAARDGKLEGFQAPAEWPKELRRAWQAEVGAGHSGPALVDGRLYVHARQGDDEVALCLDAATGKEVWSGRVAAPFEMNQIAVTHGKGPWSSPAVADGRVFTFGITSILSCHDAKTGKLLWRHPSADRSPEKAGFLWYGTAMSPVVTGGACVVHVFGPNRGAITAYDAETGKARWTWTGDEPAYASPVIATIGGRAQLITLTKSSAVALVPADGKQLWKVEFATEYDQNSVSPVVFENLVILSGTKRGTTAWAVDGPEPRQAWHTDEVSMYMSTPVLAGDRLYGFSEKRSGQFFCIDARTGKTLWTGDGRQGANAALLQAGGVNLALLTAKPEEAGRASNLVVFEAGDKGYAEKARIKVAEGPSWAHPVVSGRLIYVRDGKTLVRWDLP